jgi:hypothetical protein
MFLFCRKYIIDPHGDFFYEIKIGDGAWNTITQSPWLEYVNWGSGSLSISAIPENALISIRFGSGPNYAHIETSIFFSNGVICFTLPRIEN